MPRDNKPVRPKSRKKHGKKRAAKPLTVVKAAKSVARATLGTPRPAIRIESSKDRPKPKHKKKLADLLGESE